MITVLAAPERCLHSDKPRGLALHAQHESVFDGKKCIRAGGQAPSLSRSPDTPLYPPRRPDRIEASLSTPPGPPQGR